MADSAASAAPLSRSGPGRVLIAVYAVFALAATARAAVQIATRFEQAPVAYVLSALAGAIYIVAAVGIARSGRTSHTIAAVSCTVELLGVLAVGALSIAFPAVFPDDTVWSRFGSGYLFIPLVLPVLGLLWLRHVRRAEHSAAGTR